MAYLTLKRMWLSREFVDLHCRVGFGRNERHGSLVEVNVIVYMTLVGLINKETLRIAACNMQTSEKHGGYNRESRSTRLVHLESCLEKSLINCKGSQTAPALQSAGQYCMGDREMRRMAPRELDSQLADDVVSPLFLCCRTPGRK
jgi:hypothetical protein